MDENSTKIILAVIGLILAIVGGVTLHLKNTRRSVKQKNINITGSNNKVIGRDDKSTK
ncbi:hypothetical protein AB9J70_12000 [Elizabethkingia anophelis]|uniref:hypothetical protein n=1 Tax=Elizabethkingia anophelis TaxID=1117645 RepID=UPI00355809E4